MESVFFKERLIIAMKEKYIQIIGTVVAAAYAVFIIFLYTAEPRSVEEITIRAKKTVENAVTKGTVLTGTYEVDPVLFDRGSIHQARHFVAARDAFERADPEKRIRVRSSTSRQPLSTGLGPRIE